MPVNTSHSNTSKAPVTAVKDIKLEPGATFTANGRNYTVSDSFSIGRLEKVSIMEEELALFNERKTCHDVMRECLKLIDDYKPGAAYALLFNKLESDQKNAKLLHFTLRACCAYINYEGEDLAYLSETQIQEKINDWSEEGLSVHPFILFGMAVYKELFQSYNKDILSILTEMQSLKEALNMEMGINPTTERKSNGVVQ